MAEIQGTDSLIVLSRQALKIQLLQFVLIVRIAVLETDAHCKPTLGIDSDTVISRDIALFIPWINQQQPRCEPMSGRVSSWP